MTRIIHIISDSNIGGAGRCLVNYLRCHDRSRFAVSVILPRGSLLIPEVAALNVPYFEVDGIAERSFSPETVGTLFSLLRSEKPAIVHTHGSFSGRIAAKLCGIPLVDMKLGIFGATLTTDRALCSYGKEILLALAGPATNLLCLALCSLLPIQCEAIELFCVASCGLAILNLLPIRELDGGRIVYCALASTFSPSLASRVVGALSFGIIFSLWTLSVYLILRLGASLSLFIFSCFLFCKIFIKNAYEH